MVAKLTPIFKAVVSQGKLAITNVDDFCRYLYTLDGEVQVSVKKQKKDRSDNQNKYYWGVVVKLIADELGYFSLDVHEALKMRFLCISEKPLAITRSTATLSTAEMEDYLSKIRTWAITELQVYIPEPNEVEY